jgi:PAS domain S-box-containing protein
MGDKKSKTVLLVEDQAIVALNQKMILENNGYDVMLAHTGDKAVRMAGETRPIDLILMDIDLGPGLDGTQAAKKILEQHELPIVFLSSHTEKDIVEKTEAISSYGYILKHAGEIVLLAAMRMAFRLHEEKRKVVESEKRYRDMFESNPNPMWVYRLGDLCFLAVNDAAVHKYGYSKNEFLSMKISDIRPLEDLDRLVENVRNVKPGLDDAGRWRHRKKNGEVIDVRIISHTIDWAGQESEVVLALQN